eukprot:6466253-Amphidinium_carterae.2
MFCPRTADLQQACKKPSQNIFLATTTTRENYLPMPEDCPVVQVVQVVHAGRIEAHQLPPTFETTSAMHPELGDCSSARGLQLCLALACLIQPSPTQPHMVLAI